MNILVFADDISWNELIANGTDIKWIRAESKDSFNSSNEADAYFNLAGDAAKTSYTSFHKPVFINSVPVTLQKMAATGNMIRINGWNGFLSRSMWEVAGKITAECAAILKSLQKEIIEVPDEPGFISARIIAMIINEAYFAKNENVSTEKEIDIAMKLGTNYPYGPFEWKEKIGIKNVYRLLKTLSETDSRYTPCHLLEEEALNSQ